MAIFALIYKEDNDKYLFVNSDNFSPFSFSIEEANNKYKIHMDSIRTELTILKQKMNDGHGNNISTDQDNKIFLNLNLTMKTLEIKQIDSITFTDGLKISRDNKSTIDNIKNF